MYLYLCVNPMRLLVLNLCMMVSILDYVFLLCLSAPLLFGSIHQFLIVLVVIFVHDSYISRLLRYYIFVFITIILFFKFEVCDLLFDLLDFQPCLDNFLLQIHYITFLHQFSLYVHALTIHKFFEYTFPSFNIISYIGTSP